MRKRERENPKGRKSMFKTGENSSTYRNFREGLQRGQKIEISKKKVSNKFLDEVNDRLKKALKDNKKM